MFIVVVSYSFIKEKWGSNQRKNKDKVITSGWDTQKQTDKIMLYSTIKDFVKWYTFGYKNSALCLT